MSEQNGRVVLTEKKGEKAVSHFLLGVNEHSEATKSMAIIYVLYIAAPFSGGFTLILGAIYAYLKTGLYGTECLEAHARWLERTFWLAITMTVVAMVAIRLNPVSAYAVIPAFGIVYAYRVAKGYLTFRKGLPV